MDLGSSAQVEHYRLVGTELPGTRKVVAQIPQVVKSGRQLGYPIVVPGPSEEVSIEVQEQPSEAFRHLQAVFFDIAGGSVRLASDCSLRRR